MEEKNKGGRPATGQTPVRTARIGPIWDQAKEIADDRGDKMPHIIEPALRRYVTKHTAEFEAKHGRPPGQKDEAPRP